MSVAPIPTAESYRIPSLDGGWVEVDVTPGRVVTVKVVQARGDTFSAQSSAVDLDEGGARMLVDALGMLGVSPALDRRQARPVGASDGVLATVRRLR